MMEDDHLLPSMETVATASPFSTVCANALHLFFSQHGQSSSSPSAPDPLRSAAASKIQAAYRARRAGALLRKIAGVEAEARRLERLIQSQDTVDAVRRDGRERAAMNERLMRLLLELDAVPGVDEEVRERRRAASRRVVGMTEVLDAVAEERVEDWSAAIPLSWEEIAAELCRVAGDGDGCEGRRRRRGCYDLCVEMIFGDENVNMIYE